MDNSWIYPEALTRDNKLISEEKRLGACNNNAQQNGSEFPRRPYVYVIYFPLF